MLYRIMMLVVLTAATVWLAGPATGQQEEEPDDAADQGEYVWVAFTGLDGGTELGEPIRRYWPTEIQSIDIPDGFGGDISGFDIVDPLGGAEWQVTRTPGGTDRIRVPADRADAVQRMADLIARLDSHRIELTVTEYDIEAELWRRTRPTWGKGVIAQSEFHTWKSSHADRVAPVSTRDTTIPPGSLWYLPAASRARVVSGWGANFATTGRTVLSGQAMQILVDAIPGTSDCHLFVRQILSDFQLGDGIETESGVMAPQYRVRDKVSAGRYRVPSDGMIVLPTAADGAAEGSVRITTIGVSTSGTHTMSWSESAGPDGLVSRLYETRHLEFPYPHRLAESPLRRSDLPPPLVRPVRPVLGDVQYHALDRVAEAGYEFDETTLGDGLFIVTASEEAHAALRESIRHVAASLPVPMYGRSIGLRLPSVHAVESARAWFRDRDATAVLPSADSDAGFGPDAVLWDQHITGRTRSAARFHDIDVVPIIERYDSVVLDERRIVLPRMGDLATGHCVTLRVERRNPMQPNSPIQLRSSVLIAEWNGDLRPMSTPFGPIHQPETHHAELYSDVILESGARWHLQTAPAPTGDGTILLATYIDVQQTGGE